MGKHPERVPPNRVKRVRIGERVLCPFCDTKNTDLLWFILDMWLCVGCFRGNFPTREKRS